MPSDVAQAFLLRFTPLSFTTAFLFFVLIFMAIALFYTNKKGQGSLGMPGPWSFPFIGCMYLFRWSTFPYKTLANLARVYGDVYSLNLGGTSVVVVNSSEAVKEVLYHKGTDFAGRPVLFSFGLWNIEGESLMLKDYGQDFSNLKYKAEISLQELLNNEDFISTRSLKAVELLNNTFERFASQNSAFDPEKSIKNTIADFVMDTIFGQSISRWFYHEARILLENASSAFADTAYVGACIDFVPLMRYLTKQKLTITSLQIGRLRAFVRRVYQLHQGSLLQEHDIHISLAYCLRSNDKGHRTISSSFENNASLTVLDDDIIVYLLADIILCAYEKLSTSLRWCLARIAANEKLQSDIQGKLDDDLREGKEFWSKNFSLLAATVDETLRTSSIMPFGIPRKTTRDTNLRGYLIPKDTVIFLNLWSCCNDSNCFSNPQEFNPYRYFSSQNCEDTNAKLPSFCSFSGGERKCLGDSFARRFLVTLTEGVLRTFHLELVTPSPNKSLEGPHALTVRPKKYTICVRKRN